MGIICLLSYWKIEKEVKILKQEKRFNVEYVTVLQKIIYVHSIYYCSLTLTPKSTVVFTGLCAPSRRPKGSNCWIIKCRNCIL